MNELALFAGAGGGILGGHLLGWRTVCAVEWEPYPASVLVARQNDKILPTFPIWDDVQTFDGKPWRGIVDVISGGFPCQDISAAGKGAGIEGKRSGMWSQMARIIGEVMPRYVFVENSPMLANRGLGVVLRDLAQMGFNAKWGVLSAQEIGAPHLRERIWIVAHSKKLFGNGSKNNARASMESKAQSEFGNCHGEKVMADSDGINRWSESQQPISKEWESWDEFGWQSQIMADSDGSQCKGNKRAERSIEEHSDIGSASWWTSEPDVGRVANGVAARVDRLKAIGNGQVSAVAAKAFKVLSNYDM